MAEPDRAIVLAPDIARMRWATPLTFIPIALAEMTLRVLIAVHMAEIAMFD
jgi:hypothetical protein